MKDLGPLKYFLGIKIARIFLGMYLNQRKYTEIISKTCLMGAKPVSIPLESNHQLAKPSGRLSNKPDRYHLLIGKLIYITLTQQSLPILFIF